MSKCEIVAVESPDEVCIGCVFDSGNCQETIDKLKKMGLKDCIDGFIYKFKKSMEEKKSVPKFIKIKDGNGNDIIMNIDKIEAIYKTRVYYIDGCDYYITEETYNSIMKKLNVEEC